MNEPSTPANLFRDKTNRLILGGLLLGILLEALDTTVVNTALRTIVKDLHGQDTMAAWVVGIYLLMVTITTPLYGRLSDLYGRIYFYLGGMSLFMLGSLLCGFAQSVPQLIAFRALQGLGAGAMMPSAITLVQTVFPKEQRGKVQGMLPLAFGTATLLGPTLGGVVSDTLGWQWLFFLNLPIGILAVSILYKYLPEHARKGSQDPSARIDYAGSILMMLCTGSLMLSFTLTEIWSLSFASPFTLAMLGLSLFFGIIFVWVQRKVSSPLVPLELFRNVNFSFSVVLSFLLAGILLWNLALYVPMFMQGVLQVSATRSGLISTPMMVAIIIGSFTCGRLFGRKVKRYKILALLSSLLVLSGFGLLLAVKMSSSPTYVIFCTMLVGIGLGASMPLYGLIIAQNVERKNLGVSMGLLAFFRNLGGAFSTAFLGSMFGKKMAESLPPMTAITPLMKRMAMAASIHYVFLIGFVIAGLAVTISIFLPSKHAQLG